MNNKKSGFSYTEVLVAIFLITIVLIPAMESLLSGVQGSGIHASHARQYYRLSGKMEQVLARPFTELAQEADTAGGSTVIINAYSDDPGSNDRLLVYIARYDGDNADADNDPFTDVDNGLLWLMVEIEGWPDTLHSLCKN